MPQKPVVPSTDQLSHSKYCLKPDRYSSHSVILSYLEDARGRRLLDVGAAQGDLAQLLTLRGFKVTAIECNSELAAMAQGKCCQVIVADLDKPLPEIEPGFDVAVCGDILEHLKDPLSALVRVAQLVKSDGLIIVSVPNVTHLWVRVQFCLGRFEYTERGILDATHLRFFTLTSFRRLLQQADLETLHLTATPAPVHLVIPEHFHGRTLNAVHAVSAFAAKNWKAMFGYQFVAVTRRVVLS